MDCRDVEMISAFTQIKIVYINKTLTFRSLHRRGEEENGPEKFY